MRIATTSTKALVFRGLTVLSILFLVTFFSVQTATSGEKNSKGNTVQFNGNEIELGEQRVYPGNYINKFREQKRMFYFVNLPDVIKVKDPMTGDMVTKPVPVEVVPVAINGNPILGSERKYNIFNDWEEYNPPVYTGGVADVGTYLFYGLKATYSKLEDGVYRIGVNNLVVNNEGALAYYNHSGIAANNAPWDKAPVIDNDISRAVDKKLKEMMSSNMKFKPATNKDGKPVHARVSMDNYVIVVKEHKARLVDMGVDGGC